MNAQAQPRDVEINFRVTLPAAEIILEGLSKLSIERAGGLYAGLRNTIDQATAQAIAENSPPAPPANPEPPPVSRAPNVDLSPPSSKEFQ